MPTITITELDPVYPLVLDLLRAKSVPPEQKEPEKDAHEETSPVTAQTPRNRAEEALQKVRQLFEHLRDGTASRQFIVAAARYCGDNPSAVNKFFLDDLKFGGFNIQSKKAANRNAQRGMYAANIFDMFDKNWDYDMGAMEFEMSDPYVHSVLKVADELGIQ